nr:putative integron gene cassette protein [uncultured bacterium]
MGTQIACTASFPSFVDPRHSQKSQEYRATIDSLEAAFRVPSNCKFRQLRNRNTFHRGGRPLTKPSMNAPKQGVFWQPAGQRIITSETRCVFKVVPISLSYSGNQRKDGFTPYHSCRKATDAA